MVDEFFQTGEFMPVKMKEYRLQFAAGPVNPVAKIRPKNLLISPGWIPVGNHPCGTGQQVLAELFFRHQMRKTPTQGLYVMTEKEIQIYRQQGSIQIKKKMLNHRNNTSFPNNDGIKHAHIIFFFFLPAPFFIQKKCYNP